MAIQFYFRSTGAASRAWWALEELEIPYEKIEMPRGKSTPPEFLAINPNGSVPALTDDGVNVFESLAILVYLGEKYGLEKGLWPAPGSAASAAALSWAIWGAVTFEPPTIEYASHAADSQAHYALSKELRSEGVAQWAKKDLHVRLGILEARLEGRTYVLGDTFSLVDVALAPVVARCMFCKLDLAPYGNVRAWFARCAARPKAKDTMPDLVVT
jgi:glutathione S-transferase